MSVTPTTPATPAATAVDLANVQGNVLGGFLKDHQRFVFCKMSDVPAARNWLLTMADRVATAADVTRFNALFSDISARLGEGTIKATWVNLAFTPSGLAKLASPADLAKFEASFTADISVHAPATLNDPPANTWLAPFRSPIEIDFMLIAAADDPDDLDTILDDLRSKFETAGIQEVHVEEGEAREDDPGHEHFGYKDGVSQPNVNLTGPPYSDTDSPWRFGLFCPPAAPPAPPPPIGYPVPQPTPPPPSPPQEPPPWAHEGSYLVYRRLRQDVAALQAFVAQHPQGTGDKLVGRRLEGAPLDPSGAAAGSGNTWTFGDDPMGADTPLAAHIRKVNPRTGIEAERRILRRGIAYGGSYSEGADPGDPNGAQSDRGLQFLCYQASIANQFEFLQSDWCNQPGFPTGNAGHDPIIGQPAGGRPCSMALTPGAALTALPSQFVATTACLYLFQTSVAGLRHLAGQP